VKARADMLVGDARQAVKDDNAPLDRLRTLTAELQQIYHSLAATTSSAPSGEPEAAAGVGGGGGAAGADDVIDADFTTE
jgi:molecular chaperone DnaK